MRTRHRSNDEPRPRRRRALRILSIIVAVVVVLVGGGAIAFQVSPWPSVLVIRATGADGMSEGAAIEKYVPEGIDERLDLVYDDASPDGRIDVFSPADAEGPLPTIVWVHGGAFIAGIKEALRPYLRIVASHGFTVVNVEYTKAPEGTYPLPVQQLDAAVEFVTANADSLGVDPTQLVLAGDSAGAHIAAQFALAATDPAYADAAGIAVRTPGEDLRAAALFSGPYDLDVDVSNETFGWFLRTVLWAYSGTKAFATDPHVAYASLVDHATASFPPTLISTGPADPLRSQNELFAERLSEAGAPVTTLFFDPAASPEVGHEYQLELDTDEARAGMKALVALVRENTDGPERHGVSDDWP